MARLTTRGGERAEKCWRAGRGPGQVVPGRKQGREWAEPWSWEAAVEKGRGRPHPTPPHSIPSWRAKPLHQDDTPSLQVLHMAFRNLPGDHLIWVEASRSLPHQQPASPLPAGTPASPPHGQQHLPPFETAASAPPCPTLTPAHQSSSL